MTNIVYTTTFTKPAAPVALANGLTELTVFIPIAQVLDQTIIETGGPLKEDEGRTLCYRLTDEGMDLFRNGLPGHPGFKEWPPGFEDPVGWGTYPLHDTGRRRRSFWVFTPAAAADGTDVDRDKAEARLVEVLGRDNVLEFAKHFMPIPPATGRSQWGYFWRLSSKGEFLFTHGFVGLPDFHFQVDPPWARNDDRFLRGGDRPVPIPLGRIIEEAGDVEDIAIGAIYDAKLPAALITLLATPKPTLISELPGHTLRVIAPGDSYTMDYRPDRFNVILGQDGAIARTGFF